MYYRRTDPVVAKSSWQRAALVSISMSEHVAKHEQCIGRSAAVTGSPRARWSFPQFSPISLVFVSADHLF